MRRYGPTTVIVHGAADGVDTSFAEAADEAVSTHF
jgi:hypothetical protein